jgi:thioredoxin reductase (NADPH)
MFPVLTSGEITKVRSYGDVRRFQPGELLARVGRPSPGMYVILSGRLSVVSRDPLGRTQPVAEFGRIVGGTPEEMEILPGEFIADLGTLTEKASAIDVQAVDEVEAIVVPPDQLRALLIADADLGERIIRSPEVTKISAFLGRNGTPFRVVDPEEDTDAASLVSRYGPGDLPMLVMPDGTVLRKPTKQELGRALGLVAGTLRSEPYDVAIVGAGPAGLATAVYGASEGLSILVLEQTTFGGQAGASARIENYLGFPSGVPGQALMGRAFAQAQKFGAEFSLSTEVKRLDCISERSGPDPVLVLHLSDGRQVRARAVVVATGARYRRPEIPDLPQFEGRGVSYWASPAEARLCRGEDVALIGGGNSAGQAAVFLSGLARQVTMLVRGPGLSDTMSRYLIDRISSTSNIAILCETEVVQLTGAPDQGLQNVRWRHRRTRAEEERAIGHLFVFTGADPAASWMEGCGVPLDERGFVRTGSNAGVIGRPPLPMETSVSGIFAVGDVRSGSVKRVGAAIGEGAAVVAQIHAYLARRGPAAREAQRPPSQSA